MAKRKPKQLSARLHVFHLDRGTRSFKCDLCGLGMNMSAECSHPDAPLWKAKQREGDQEDSPEVNPWEPQESAPWEDVEEPICDPA
jgi:hypothetical protein